MSPRARSSVRRSLCRGIDAGPGRCEEASCRRHPAHLARGAPRSRADRRALRDPGPDRSRRHGRGVRRPRSHAGAHGRGQAAAQRRRRRRRDRRDLRPAAARGARAGVDRLAARGRGPRRRGHAGRRVPGDAAAVRPHARRGDRPGRPDVGRARLPDLARHPRRAGSDPRRRPDPPRSQGVQRPARPRRSRGAARPRRGAPPAPAALDRARHGAGHARVHGARAAHAGPARRAGRPVPARADPDLPGHRHDGPERRRPRPAGDPAGAARR